jgi:hypothetical protein
MKTKFRALLLLVLLSAAHFSYGQIPVGPKVGINFNSLRGNKMYRVTPGFNIGGFAKYKVLSFLSARAEVLYFQQGADLNDYYVISPELYHSNAKVRFHNLQLPVLAEFGLPSLAEEALQPKLMLGGFYSYTIAAQESYHNVTRLSGYGKRVSEGSTNISDSFIRSQYGVIGAVAAEIKMFAMPVSIEFRYQYNIPRVNKGGTQSLYNLERTHDEWGDKLYLSTLSINVAVTLLYL